MTKAEAIIKINEAEATESLPEDMSILFEAIAGQADSPLLGMEKTDD